MKYVSFVAWLFVSGAVFAAETALALSPAFTPAPAGLFPITWNLLWAGSWEEGKTLVNRGDMRLGLPLPGLTLRGQFLDKRPLDFGLDPPWTDSAKAVSSFSGGLYHEPTDSRLLYGVLDERGLPARIRSPWIRSAPFAENHRPLSAELKTATSSTKEPEAYLYLSSPRLALFSDGVFPETSLRGFASAQIHAEGEGGSAFANSPAFAGGLEAVFGKKAELLAEGFYTEAELPARKSNAWFSNPPPLPARDFSLGAVGLLLRVPSLSVSADWAWSETFAWGRDVYGNLGIRFNPQVPATPGKSPKNGPWSISLAADGAGERYIGRDGSSPGAGFRSAGKFEWKGARSSLFRASASLRAPGIGESFERSSTGLYYRFPAPAPAGRAADKSSTNAPIPLRVNRISLNIDRNAANPAKTLDGIDGTLGLSLNLPPVSLPGFSPQSAGTKTGGAKNRNSPLGITVSGAVKGLTSSDETPAPFPIPHEAWRFDSAKGNCELSWSPGIFQFRTKWGYAVSAQKEGQWDTSFSVALRSKQGRLIIKAASHDFPHKWNCTASWRFEKK